MGLCGIEHIGSLLRPSVGLATGDRRTPGDYVRKCLWAYELILSQNYLAWYVDVEVRHGYAHDGWLAHQ